MPLGKCKMCLKEKALVSSHLMPAALYDYCRKEEHRPIKVGDGFVIPTDRKTQDYLLCQECEDLLNKGGEKWIADKLATWERSFPLYDLLTKVPPEFDEDGMIVYSAAKNSDIEVNKLEHFALGLFWKAAVHSWRGSTRNPRMPIATAQTDAPSVDPSQAKQLEYLQSTIERDSVRCVQRYTPPRF